MVAPAANTLEDALAGILKGWDRDALAAVALSLSDLPAEQLSTAIKDLIPDAPTQSAVEKAVKKHTQNQGKSAGKANSPPANQPNNGDGKVFGMFKQGGKLRAKVAGQGGSSTALNVSPGPGEKLVANCLGCGRIFDRRNTTNPDVLKFIERGGQCTFCGRYVSLTGQPVGSDGPDTAGSSQQAGDPAAASSAAAAGSSAEDAAARAFKDRLVQYDRESAKRTQVIDDQSDYFEVDSNVWLTDEERRRIRERRRIEEEAEKARRQRVAVTVDLLGRRVLLADAAASVGTGAAFRTGEDSLVEAYDPKASSANAPMWTPTPGDASLTSAQGGPPKVQELQHNLKEAADQLRRLRATACPGQAAPRYVPPPAASVRQRDKPGGKSRDAAARVGISRVQDDPTDVFDTFEAEVLDIEVQSALLAAEETCQFDLCPPDYRDLPAPAPAPPLTQVPNEVTDTRQLPAGLVLLRGWLSAAQQAEVVGLVRELGLGPGGFYTPSYGPGQVMHLRMMGLGMHWEPRTHSYEHVRAVDGAAPPAIPTRLKELCAQALSAANEQAQSLQGTSLPSLSPDICLVNYYNKTGRLGMHQDKDETRESLSRGTPVVSFSLGDTADFAFGESNDEAKARVVRLRSGDVLVFGGPARLIYHGVPRIYPNTAPSALLTSTGLRPGRLNLTFRQL